TPASIEAFGGSALHWLPGVTMEAVNLQQKFGLFQEHYSPKIVGELNGQHVKLVKFKGDFTWHTTSTRTKCSWWSKAAS
ncbi:MAG: hypothetical protein ABIP81_02380, partial [Terriglobales bacterium]